MNRLIVNFGDVQATHATIRSSGNMALKFAEKFPDTDRVTVSWTSPEEAYVFRGKRVWREMMLFEITGVENDV